MNIKDLSIKLLSYTQQKAIRNEDSVSLGGGGRVFLYPYPRVVISHHLWSCDLLSVVSVHVCKNVEFFQLCLYVGWTF